MPSVSQLILYRAIDMKSCNPANLFMRVRKMHWCKPDLSPTEKGRVESLERETEI